MVIVKLEDGTVYYIDTDNEYNARSVVRYKLSDRLDYRRISNVVIMEGVILDKDSKVYNSDNQFDGKELKCVSGWSYKWR